MKVDPAPPPPLALSRAHRGAAGTCQLLGCREAAASIPNGRFQLWDRAHGERDAILAADPRIAHLSGTGRGLHYMYLDSSIRVLILPTSPSAALWACRYTMGFS